MGLAAGQVLQDRYKVVRIIKSGGFGAVYEGIDTKLADSPCAIKEILEEARTGQDGDYVTARFYEEMKALSKLDHPAIPKVRDYLTVNATAYIVMDLIQGRSLLEEVMESQVPLDAELVAQDMIALLDALTYLHNQEPPIIHRDIKPANVLRDRRSGTIKLVDFGLARQVQGPKTQTMVGTLGYSAPEQMMGKAERRSDLYSVGVTMEHLLTGKIPDPQLLKGHRPDLPNVRPGLVEIIDRSTQPKMDDRFASAQQMSEALKAWLHKSGPLPAPDSPRTEVVETRPKGSGIQAIGAVVALLAAVGLGMALGRRAQPPTRPVTSTPAPISTPSPTAAVLPPPPPPAPVSPPKPPTASPVAVTPPLPAPIASPDDPTASQDPEKTRLKAYLQDVELEVESLHGLGKNILETFARTGLRRIPPKQAAEAMDEYYQRLSESQGRFMALKAPRAARDLRRDINFTYDNWLAIIAEAQTVLKKIPSRPGRDRRPPTELNALTQRIQQALRDQQSLREKFNRLKAEAGP